MWLCYNPGHGIKGKQVLSPAVIAKLSAPHVEMPGGNGLDALPDILWRHDVSGDGVSMCRVAQ